jgi:predicted nucleic acid-binding protein
MKVVLDTNVVLDLLLDRSPHAEAAAQVFSQVECGQLAACICATTITTIHYVAYKTVGDAAAREHLTQLLRLVEVAPVTRHVVEHALVSPMADFEDAVLAHAAALSGAEAVITRNGRDFHGGPLRVYSPAQWLAADSA